MAVYAIGDLQGCFDHLLRLLDSIAFNEREDRLWFVGDLVNRGPKSLETLRFIKNLGESAVVVLGNHDLHLLAAANSPLSANKKETLNQVLLASDRDELIDWLRHRPLFHYDAHFCMVHAGIPPQWTFDLTCRMADIVQKELRSPNYRHLLKAMYGNKPDMWSPLLRGTSRLRFIVNAFTRMRYCDSGGRLDFDFNGPPGSQPPSLMPWFEVPSRKKFERKIVFGHWSSLGFYAGKGCYGIDTGCLWGGQLTALKLGMQVERVSIDY